MIAGHVRDSEAFIHLTVHGTRRRQRTIEAVIDTGYTSFLTLPPAIIKVLGLRKEGKGHGIMADGRECEFDVYKAAIVWDGATRRVQIDEAETMPLVGMKLLNGYELNIQIREGGNITITKLS